MYTPHDWDSLKHTHYTLWVTHSTGSDCTGSQLTNNTKQKQQITGVVCGRGLGGRNVGAPPNFP